MTERDYILATTLAKVRTLIAVYRDIGPPAPDSECEKAIGGPIAYGQIYQMLSDWEEGLTKLMKTRVR